jgi:hypothetical protein
VKEIRLSSPGVAIGNTLSLETVNALGHVQFIVMIPCVRSALTGQD